MRRSATPARLLFALAACGGSAVLGGCGGSDAAMTTDPGEPIEVEVAFGEAGRAPGQFAYPRAIARLADGLVILDKAGRVQHVGPDGSFRAGFEMPEFELGKPTGVTVGPHPFEGDRDAIYIADTHYQRVLVFEAEALTGSGADSSVGGLIATPEPVLSFGSYGWGDGEMIYPTDVALLIDDAAPRRVQRLYVSEYGGNDRVSVYELDAESRGASYLFSFGEQGGGPGVEFDRPQAMAFDPDSGELLISDGCNHRIGRFTPAGELIAWIGGAQSDEPDRFMYPYGLTPVGPGEVLVSEFGSCRVQRVDVRTGKAIAWYGRPGRLAGELDMPWGVALLGGLAYVLDSGNNRVQGFEVPGPRRVADGGDGDGWGGE